MIQQMDSAMLALQSAAGARRLYGHQHAAVQRQTTLAAELFTAMFAQRRSVRLVHLDNTLIFDDQQLPSGFRLNDVLAPMLTAHGIEWIEFHSGLARAELVELLDQLERPPAPAPASASGSGSASAPAPAAQIGSHHIRVGCLGRAQPTPASTSAVIAALDLDHEDQITQLKRIWHELRMGARGGQRPDQRLSELVESIRLAVAVGADVCQQLAEIKNHDEYTFVHTVNVAILSAALGEAAGMKPNQVFDLTLAALLHDVGKQHTPVSILNKPGKLDESERRRMELHTIDGAAILLARSGVPDFAPIVAFEHHANLDGTGYPDLRRNRRPHLASQIVHVADVFDALRTNRPYRPAMEHEKVKAILLESAGKSFDHALVDLFLERVVKSAEQQQKRPASVSGSPAASLEDAPGVNPKAA